MESTNPVPSLSSNIPINNRLGDISQRLPKETTAPPPVARFGRYQVFEYEVLTYKESIVQNCLKQSRFPHDKDDPKLQGSLETSIYFGTPIIQHAACCLPVCRAIEKYLSMRDIVTLIFLNESTCDYRLLISTLVEKYYSHSPAIQANYRSFWQSQFTSPSERLTLWLERYFDKSDKAWVEEDGLRQAALHRYLCNRANTIKCAATLTENLDLICSMTTLSNGQIVSGTSGGFLKIWDLTKPEGEQCVTTLSGHDGPILCILAPASEQIISGALVLKVWDLTKSEGDQCVATLREHTARINYIAMHPNGKIISAAHNGTLIVWDPTKPKGEPDVAILRGHTGRVKNITVLTDGKIISCSKDRTLRVWDLTKPEKERCVAVLSGHTDWANYITMLTDGQIISCSDDHTLRIWDPAKSEKERSVAILRGHTHRVNGVLELADGKIISCSRDCTLRIWDLTKPEEERCVAILSGHADWVNCIAMLPNGQVVSCSYDSTLRVWDPSALIDLDRHLLPDMPQRSDTQADHESPQSNV